MGKKAKPVAIFNAKYKLIGIFRSIKEASDITGTARQSIMKNINGEALSAKKHYWRNIPDDFIVDSDDIGSLTLFNFDKEVGNPDRHVYGKGKMRKRSSIMHESCQAQ